MTSLADSKFALIEFSPELMNVNIDELMEKFLLLENVDFELVEWSLKWLIIKTNQMIKQRTIINPTIGSRTTTMHINISNKEMHIAFLVTCTLSENKSKWTDHKRQ